MRMADIAEKLGISIVSVSKGLSGKDGVSEEMRAKIIATAKELGYEPPAQKAAPQERTENIGILVPDYFFEESTFYSNLYRAVVNRSTALGYACLMELVSLEAESTCALPNLLTQNKVDALFFMGEFDHEYIKAVTKRALPYVLLDFYDTDLDSDCVIGNNITGGYMLTRHLLDTGRKNIGFVGSINATTSIMDRYLGYVRALHQAGIEPNPVWRIEDRGPDRKYMPLALPETMPDAFVCNNDEVAFHLVECLNQAGYAVPADVAVVGYDDYRFSTICRPQLTTYHVYIDEMAAAALECIQHKFANLPSDTSTHIIPGAFVLRNST